VDNGGMAAALREDSAYLSEQAPLPDQETQAVQCCAILWGHETAVISIFLSTNLDLLASGSVDGAIVLHQVRKGKYVRRIQHPNNRPVNVIHMSPSGDIVVHSWMDRSLHVFSLNGFHLSAAQLRQRLYAMTITTDGEMIVAGGTEGKLAIFLMHNLQQVHEMNIGNGPIRSLTFTPDHQYILVGSENGKFSIVADPLSRLHMLHRVLSKTFFGAI
jgi:WD40 repeat protein